MRVVLDTNIWLSGTFWEGEAYKLISTIQSTQKSSKKISGVPENQRFSEQKKIDVVVTKKILLEIVEVLNKEAKFQKFIKNRKIAIEDLLRTITDLSKLVDSKTKLNIVKEHSSDNKFVECAIDGKAEFIISYDKHLLKLKEYKGIKILSPTEFVRMLN